MSGHHEFDHDLAITRAEYYDPAGNDGRPITWRPRLRHDWRDGTVHNRTPDMEVLA